MYLTASAPFSLTARHGPHDEEGLLPVRDRLGQGGLWQLVGQVLLAGEEPDERSAPLRDVVADRPAQHRIAGLERVEDRALRDLTLDVELHVAFDLRELAQMWRKD